MHRLDEVVWTSDDAIFISHKTPADQIQLKPIGDEKYRLEFNSEELDPILIEVYNIEGKRLFKKKVKNFYGRFVKEIELEDNGIGVLTVKVEQGEKKIIGEFEYK